MYLRLIVDLGIICFLNSVRTPHRYPELAIFLKLHPTPHGCIETWMHLLASKETSEPMWPYHIHSSRCTLEGHDCTLELSLGGVYERLMMDINL